LEFGTSDLDESRRLMARAVALLPPEWLTTGAAVGSIARCIERLQEYLDAGVDQILLHGTTPDMQGPLVAAARAHRR
jgi:alkanesulfonate monooxygenase SsuD/methylene tetrahydromethanopterin reductase-like flavin-dependent oxidoreductase (luciferase family)